MPTGLSTANLTSIAGRVSVPRYRRADLKPGIVHFGVGNFHRAHQAVYLDALFNLGLDHDWAVVGAGMRDTDGAMRNVLAAQDWLTTVVEQEATARSAHVTGAMVDFLPVGDVRAITMRLADPSTRIVSLTVTEGGYYIDPATQAFDSGHSEIIADSVNPEAPRTVFGLILLGLQLRRERGLAPFTVMSCDNIPGNGHAAENAVAGLAGLIDPELARWVRNSVAFPSSMVDRITPATGERERRLVVEQFGIADGWPVFCEGFRQWVLEDKFPLGRPALEQVGVQFVPDVAPFELMKIRILNGGHATIAYPAGLMDIHFVHEAMQHPVIRAFLEKVERDEIIPVVPPVPDTSLDDYFASVERRFANPAIGDTIQRLCLDGAYRQPMLILPSARDRLAEGSSVTGLALVSALWARYCYGESDSGKPISPNDPIWPRLTALARQSRADPAAWLGMGDIFGDLASNSTYAAAFTRALGSLWQVGTEATLQRYLAGNL